ncbi:putative quinol monooxygenase [Acuticoccus mangrovi]|uniref:Antibiotic biosynthesis monooxygenase n=1 Tax=Acuticoccus mangrovi TaxID=2796142 RepID=A0A934INH3_9HYPH|nr:putative quinol monooxygenase [Acuticoccus mangrovi]MBJ3777122.1 antibiotic biosynthesis monooxygenase [Acuticoccus mangrovi]
MPSQAKITAILTAKPGKTAALVELLETMAPRCRAEPGNLRWDIWEDPAQEGRFVLDELYVDDAAIVAHRDTPHFKDYLARIGDLAERTALVLRPKNVTPTSS